MNKLFRALISVLVIGLVCGLLWWLLDYIQLGAPFDKVGHIAIAVFGVFALIYVIMDVADFRPWRNE